MLFSCVTIPSSSFTAQAASSLRSCKQNECKGFRHPYMALQPPNCAPSCKQAGSE